MKFDPLLMYVVSVKVYVCVFSKFIYKMAANKHAVSIFVAGISCPQDKLRIMSHILVRRATAWAHFILVVTSQKDEKSASLHFHGIPRCVLFRETMDPLVSFIFPEINLKLPFHRAQSASSVASIFGTILRKLHSFFLVTAFSFTTDAK